MLRTFGSMTKPSVLRSRMAILMREYAASPNHFFRSRLFPRRNASRTPGRTIVSIFCTNQKHIIRSVRHSKLLHPNGGLESSHLLPFLKNKVWLSAANFSAGEHIHRSEQMSMDAYHARMYGQHSLDSNCHWGFAEEAVVDRRHAVHPTANMKSEIKRRVSH